eukprot:12051587-Alexandrium_andersonii.AAC.1
MGAFRATVRASSESARERYDRWGSDPRNRERANSTPQASNARSAEPLAFGARGPGNCKIASRVRTLSCAVPRETQIPPQK